MQNIPNASVPIKENQNQKYFDTLYQNSDDDEPFDPRSYCHSLASKSENVCQNQGYQKIVSTDGKTSKTKIRYIHMAPCKMTHHFGPIVFDDEDELFEDGSGEDESNLVSTEEKYAKDISDKKYKLQKPEAIETLKKFAKHLTDEQMKALYEHTRARRCPCCKCLKCTCKPKGYKEEPKRQPTKKPFISPKPSKDRRRGDRKQKPLLDPDRAKSKYEKPIKGKDIEGKDKEGKGKEEKDKEEKDKEGKYKERKDKEGKDEDGKDKEGKGEEGKDKDRKTKEGKDKEGKDKAYSTLIEDDMTISTRLVIEPNKPEDTARPRKEYSTRLEDDQVVIPLDQDADHESRKPQKDSSIRKTREPEMPGRGKGAATVIEGDILFFPTAELEDTTTKKSKEKYGEQKLPRSRTKEKAAKQKEDITSPVAQQKGTDGTIFEEIELGVTKSPKHGEKTKGQIQIDSIEEPIGKSHATRAHAAPASKSETKGNEKTFSASSSSEVLIKLEDALEDVKDLEGTTHKVAGITETLHEVASSGAFGEIEAHVPEADTENMTEVEQQMKHATGTQAAPVSHSASKESKNTSTASHSAKGLTIKEDSLEGVEVLEGDTPKETDIPQTLHKIASSEAFVPKAHSENITEEVHKLKVVHRPSILSDSKGLKHLSVKISSLETMTKSIESQIDKPFAVIDHHEVDSLETLALSAGDASIPSKGSDKKISRSTDDNATEIDMSSDQHMPIRSEEKEKFETPPTNIDQTLSSIQRSPEDIVSPTSQALDKEKINESETSTLTSEGTQQKEELVEKSSLEIPEIVTDHDHESTEMSRSSEETNEDELPPLEEGSVEGHKESDFAPKNVPEDDHYKYTPGICKCSKQRYDLDKYQMLSDIKTPSEEILSEKSVRSKEETMSQDSCICHYPSVYSEKVHHEIPTSIAAIEYIYRHSSKMYERIYNQKKYNYQKTVVIIKPDAVKFKDVILRAIESEGLNVTNERFLHITPEQAAEIYSENYGSSYFSMYIEQLSSSPLLVLSVAGLYAVNRWKKLISPGNKLPSHWFFPDSIKRRFQVTSDVFNAMKCSSDYLTSKNELRYFFPLDIIDPIFIESVEVQDYCDRYIHPTLLKALYEIIKNKPDDPLLFLAEWLLTNNPYQPHYLDKMISLLPT